MSVRAGQAWHRKTRRFFSGGLIQPSVLFTYRLISSSISRACPCFHRSFRAGLKGVASAKAWQAVAYLVACESSCVSVKHLDSNHAYSYGVGQIQSSTWQMFKQQSGLSGDPMSPTNTVPMMLWAVEHGFLQRWSCAKLTGLIP